MTKKEDEKTVAKAKKTPSIPTKTPKVERKRKVSKYKSFRLNKKIPHPAGPLPSSMYILKKSLKLIKKNRKVLLGILAIYIFLNLVLVRGFVSPLDVGELKDNINDTFGDSLNGVSLAGAIFGSLLNSSNTPPSETSSLYQTILFIIVSLAIIWVFRQSAAGKKPTLRGSFYDGLYPIAPFLLVLSTLLLQSVPALIGNFIYGTITSNGIAVTGLEQVVWTLFFGSLLLLSLYMICSSVFALYVVTLPGMHPLRALRSSRQLVFSRRLNVFRKFLVVPTLALLVLVLIVVPAIYFLPVIAPWLYFVLSLASIVLLHAYLFTLYRELL